jgi:hypothetical protein
MSGDNPGWDVPLSLCPGTKIFPCLDVPLSRDKGRSKNPGTNSSTGTSRDKITFPKKTKKQEKDVLKPEKDVINRKGSSKTGKDF